VHTTNKHQFHIIFSSLFILSYTLQNDTNKLVQIWLNNMQYSFRYTSKRFWLNIAITRAIAKGDCKGQNPNFPVLFCHFFGIYKYVICKCLSSLGWLGDPKPYIICFLSPFVPMTIQICPISIRSSHNPHQSPHNTPWLFVLMIMDLV